MEKREPSCTVGGNVNWYCHLVQPPSIEEIPLKTKEKKKNKQKNQLGIKPPHDPAIPHEFNPPVGELRFHLLWEDSPHIAPMQPNK